MKYIILVLWTFSLFLLMFSSFPFRVECRPTRAMGPGPPYLPGTGVLAPQQYSSPASALGVRVTGRFGSSSACPVLEDRGAPPNRLSAWSELYVTDITEKTWETPLVLEGIARSRSDVGANGTYGVTFDLIRVVKGDAPLLLRRRRFRLQFLDNPSGSNNTSGMVVMTMSTARNTGLIPAPSRTSPGGSAHFTSTQHNHHHQKTSNSNNNPSSNNNFNRALGLRSNSNSNQQQHQQQRSSRGGGGTTNPRVANSGGISLKSSNLHSNYVSFQQQLSRRAYLGGGRPLRGNLTRNSNNVNLNSPSSSQTVQFTQSPTQFSRNYHSSAVSSSPSNLTSVSVTSSRSKSVRIARSHQQQQQQQSGRHGRRHGRVVGPHNSFSVVNSASGGSGNFGGGGDGKCRPPRATVKTGRKYFVFAAKVENHFVAVFSPELANKRNTKSVEGILCKGCGKAPLVVAQQKEAVLQPKERLRLRCRLKAGNPIPVLTWYKDGRLVNLTDPRFRLRAKRRQSVLVIRKAKEMDIGVYTCEGRNVFGSHQASTRVSLAQQPPPTLSPPPQKPAKPPSPKPVGTTPTPRWAVPSSVCPFDSYCLNGGTCSYYETIGEYVCHCAEGYKGQRCDTKDIPNSGSYLSYFCIFGTNNPDYPC